MYCSLQANLGAKNHATVMPDADKDATINAIIGAAFGAAGQRYVTPVSCFLVCDILVRVVL